MFNSKSGMEFSADIKRPLPTASNGKKRRAIIALTALSIALAIAWDHSDSKTHASVTAAVVQNQSNQTQPSRTWDITVNFKDGTSATGQTHYDPPGVGRAVSIRVHLSCGHTHLLHGIQTAEDSMQGDGDANRKADSAQYAFNVGQPNGNQLSGATTAVAPISTLDDDIGSWTATGGGG